MKTRNKVTGNLETVYVKGRDNIPVGTIFAYPGSTAPTGYLICDGSTFSQTLYPELYQVLGSNTLPDLREKFLLGSSSNYALGSTGGEAEHTLTENEIPSHKHNYLVKYYLGGNPGINGDAITGSSQSGMSLNYYTAIPEQETSSIGGGQAHNNMPPFKAVNYIIKAYHTNLSSSSNIVNEHSNSSDNAYSCAYMNGMLEAENLNWTADYTYLENVSSANRIGNLAIISLTVKSNWTGIGKTLLNLTDYNFANSGVFAITAYNGVDGEIFIDVNSDRIGASISNNIGYGKATIIATITPK